MNAKKQVIANKDGVPRLPRFPLNPPLLTMFDDLIGYMECRKILSPKVTELFLRRRKLNISLFCITILFQSA